MVMVALVGGVHGLHGLWPNSRYFCALLRIMTGDDEASQDRAHVAAALRVLGIENLVLVIHDQSYPSDASEDTGRGSPYSSGARRFLELARALGFNGIQFGPQGDTSRVNP